MKPLAVDLCAGLGGWTTGLLAEGWDVVGFDIERHQYGGHRYPAQLVLQDILTLDGRQFRGKCQLIVASPPCQKYSYMAMPWTKAKALAVWYRDQKHPERIDELNRLFHACFRIADEAQCPIVLENVRGAQPWVGRAAWRFGSFYLWGDVPALMPITKQQTAMKAGDLGWRRDGHKPTVAFKGKSMSFDGTVAKQLLATKNDGGSWFNVAHNTTSGKGQNPANDAFKGSDGGWFNDNKRAGKGPTGRLSQSGSKSTARKAASAHIAKIPFVLARHIALSWKPND